MDLLCNSLQRFTNCQICVIATFIFRDFRSTFISLRSKKLSILTLLKTHANCSQPHLIKCLLIYPFLEYLYKLLWSSCGCFWCFFFIFWIGNYIGFFASHNISPVISLLSKSLTDLLPYGLQRLRHTTVYWKESKSFFLCLFTLCSFLYILGSSGTDNYIIEFTA